MKITFPNKTAEQIVKECNNRLGEGKLIYDTSWYKNEKFFTTEKCRKGTRDVSDDIEYLEKSWNECKELVGEDNMLNFPEMIWFVKTYFEKTGEYPKYWSWTSSRSSAGRLVSCGGADAGGVFVSRDYPRDSFSIRGVRFFRGGATHGAKGGQPEADYRNLETRVKAIENWIRNVKDQLL